MILARFKKDTFFQDQIVGWFQIKPCPMSPFKYVCLDESYTQEWLEHPQFVPEKAIPRALLEFKRD